MWLFYVQHQFEETQSSDAGGWSFHDAALHGRSHYELPRLLAWFTGNIGVPLWQDRQEGGGRWTGGCHGVTTCLMEKSR